MDIRHLRYFLGVVDHGSFGRAAAQLHIAQPSLSQAIAALERELGVELFHRIGRRVMVSGPGLALIEPARRAVRDLDEVEATVESLKGGLVGQVDIAVLPSQGVEPFSTIAEAFGRQYPGVTIRALAAYTGDEVTDLLNSGMCELGLLGTTKFSPPADVEVEHIGHQEMILVGLPGKPFEDGSTVHHRDLAGQRLLSSSVGSVMRQVVDDVLASGVDAKLVVEVDHRSSILPMVLAGGGLAVLSDAWTGVARKSGAAVMHLVPTQTIQIDLVYRSGHPLSPAAAAFVKVTKEHSARSDR